MSVYVDMESSHASTHFDDTPGLMEIIKEIIPTLTPTEDWVRTDVDTGREIGLSDLVKTDAEDETLYAKRPHREQYARFVKNRKPVSTSFVTVDLRKESDGTYNLYTAFVGELTPSFPGGNYLPERSKEFWSNHALVWGRQEIIPGTETKECPW